MKRAYKRKNGGVCAHAPLSYHPVMQIYDILFPPQQGMKKTASLKSGRLSGS